jgi:hypothetical protein
MRLLKVAKRMYVLQLAQPGTCGLHSATTRTDRIPSPFRAQHSDGGQSRLAGVRSGLTH